MKRRIIICLFVLALPVVATAQNRALRILLTNDDGFDAAGLTVMRAALIAAGHQVTVAAPAVNQSSTSMSMTSGVIKYENKGDGVWAVQGTPADAVTIGLRHILRDAPPDLVISGTNAGQNLGTNANGSGTVSAAIAAARFGIPAIATSAGLGAGSAAAYALAATLTNQMIAALGATRPAGERLLPDGLVINMNVPSSAVLDIRWAPLSRLPGFTRVYSDTGTANEVRSQLTPTTSAGTETDTDLALFLKGYVTLTLLDGDLSVTGAAVTARLTKLQLPRL